MPEFDSVDLTDEESENTWKWELPEEPPIGVVVVTSGGTLFAHGREGWISLSYAPDRLSWGELLHRFKKVEMYFPDFGDDE